MDPGTTRAELIIRGLRIYARERCEFRPKREAGHMTTLPEIAKPNRLHYIDAARSFAIMLALFSHSQYVFGFFNELPMFADRMSKLITRAATPTFIMLFGTMLEIVYVRKVLAGSGPGVKGRLLWRSFQCYLGYLAIAAAAVVSGILSFPDFLLSAGLMHNPPNAPALKFYTLALLLAWPLLYMRCQYGLRSVGVAAAFVWLATPVMGLIPFDNLHTAPATLTATLFGQPKRIQTISIAHALTLIALGMYFGRILSQQDRKLASRQFLRASGLVILTGVVVVAVRLSDRVADADVHGAREVLGVVLAHLTRHFRFENDIGYYAFGSVHATLVLLFFFMMASCGRRVQWMSPLLIFGKKSLLAFCLGNVILNLATPLGARIGAVGSPIVSTAACVSYLAIVYVILRFLPSGWNFTQRLAHSSSPGVPGSK